VPAPLSGHESRGKLWIYSTSAQKTEGTGAFFANRHKILITVIAAHHSLKE
jgi:hypothetical protein